MSTTIVARTNNVTAIVSKKGKVVGQKYAFGTLTAAEIRAAGKDIGLKGNALTVYVNKALTDESAQRKAGGAVFLSLAESKGMLPDSGDLRSGSACLRLVMPKAPKAEKADDSVADAISAMKAKGMTAAEIVAALEAK